MQNQISVSGNRFTGSLLLKPFYHGETSETGGMLRCLPGNPILK